MKSQTFLENRGTEIRNCPYCRENLTGSSIHVCPAECCYVDPGIASRLTVCPYWGMILKPGVDTFVWS